MQMIASHRIREVAPGGRAKKRSEARRIEETPARPTLRKARKPVAAVFGATLGFGIAATSTEAQVLGPTLDDFAVLAGTTVTNTGPSVVSAASASRRVPRSSVSRPGSCCRRARYMRVVQYPRKDKLS